MGKWAGSIARMSRPTDRCPDCSSRASIARETSSRGASSSTNRSPERPCRVAPSPRIASVTRKPSRPRTPMTAVGWNCSSSRSARAAPAAWASSRPTPWEPGGLVVRAHSAAAPPVAITTARAAITRPSSQTRPRQRGWVESLSVHSACARARSNTLIRGSSAARAESWRTTRRPVALPPACTTRLTEWPPSRPSARCPKRSASKRTPRACRSRTHSGASRTSDLGGRAPHQGAPRELGVAQVQLAAVVGGQGGGEAALRPVAGGLRQGRGRDEHHARPFARGAQRGVQSGRARTHHCDVGLRHLVPAPGSCPTLRSRSSTARPRLKLLVFDFPARGEVRWRSPERAGHAR